MFAEILVGLTAISAGINLWQWVAAARFSLHCREGKRDFTPAITLFKPLKGADDYTFNCLESWFAQDFGGETQILFGVADENDPVCTIVRELLALYPQRDAELVICQPLLGANAKVSTLTHLEKRAKHDFWIVSDADVFAPEDLLTEIVGKFREEKVGLVSCFYKLRSPETFGMLWESIAINADFWSQVCQSNSMKPMNFALGAVMAARRAAVQKIGGFQSLVNQLADDYQLGRRIYDAGYRIELSNVPVECREAAKSFLETWKHQLRWARTIRVCQPGPYFASVLSNLTLFATVAGNLQILLGALAVRCVTAGLNSYRMSRRREAFMEAFLFAPFKDVLQFAVWVAAFAGSSVIWRGQQYRVRSDGELTLVD